MKEVAKRLMVRSASLPGLGSSLRSLLRGRATVFMLHRFRVPGLGVAGHDPRHLRSTLALLRREGYELLPLEELFRRLIADDERLAGAVAFTLDDGYAEQASVAGAIFAEFDCPSTTFLTSGFLDRQVWMWWDQIDFVVQGALEERIPVLMRTVPDLPPPEGGWTRYAAREALTAWCKTLPDDEMRSTVREVAAVAAVDLPEEAPTRYAPMTWAEARRWETRGMTFGPHTVTHPILSRTVDRQSAWELDQSWRRLMEELEKPVPIFCYPNGQADDFGEREIETLRSLELLGAVSGRSGYAASRTRSSRERWNFEVPRFSWPESTTDMLQYVTGIERLKELIRGEDRHAATGVERSTADDFWLGAGRA